ncbi:GNAT family N-acetyltransferase [Faecalibacterium longum]|jgi:GNAT superfamily N-acetyltransferase|uniref:GNAT family N-acetyltransferase n=1 Tax=Faecalibacterium longum TaxID=1851428 RepID=A0ABV1IP38_9FIRM|nr:GNAT family N-acetyltransferase [Faecalibacterium longum]MCC2182664.1 GNAT family N-acetyltransferase [Faecalibacterium longum CLA-AA-H236]
MNPTRKTDESFYRLFSASHTVSEHLTKREDSELRDKYDHNAFCYSGQPTEDELRAALAYQKARGDAFLKLEGYEPLANAFGMECEETLTMVLPPETDIRSWKTNPDVSIKAPDFDQLEQHELKYYGPLYGEDFTVRNNRHLREKLTYLGAYLGGKLAGDCYIFASDGYVCMDSLLIDEAFRHQYIATTLVKHIAEKAQERGEILYLHADSEDTPKELYAKMGFQAVDKLYEYLCTDFSKLKI